MILTCIKYLTTLEASPLFLYDIFSLVYNFLILQHENMKKFVSQKMYVKMKTFLLVCEKIKNCYQWLLVFSYLYEVYLHFVKMAIWFYFSENDMKKGKETYKAFIDLEKAYDQDWKDAVLYTLWNRGI